MIDIKKIREERAALYAEVEKTAETYADALPEVQAEHDAKLDKLAKLVKAEEMAVKMATFAYTNERPEGVAADVKRPVAVAASKTADQIVVEAYNAAPTVSAKEAYSRGVGEWIATGNLDESYATIISTSANGLLMPRVVDEPIVLTRLNGYRKALAYFGETAESLGSTADLSVPVITGDSGGKIPENSTGVACADTAVVSALNLKVEDYHSGSFGWSRKMFLAPGYDYAEKTRPALAAAKDHGFAKEITAVIKADANVTNVVTTPTVNTISLDTLDDAIAAVGTLYANRIAVLLGTSGWNAANKLKDSTGVPILSRNDVQGVAFTSYKGVPVIKDDTLDAMGTAGNLVGVVIGIDGFKLRDEAEELVRFAPTCDAPTSIRIDLIGDHGFAYVPEAVVKIKN